jgi:hypothetical protein
MLHVKAAAIAAKNTPAVEETEEAPVAEGEEVATDAPAAEATEETAE